MMDKKNVVESLGVCNRKTGVMKCMCLLQHSCVYSSPAGIYVYDGYDDEYEYASTLMLQRSSTSSSPARICPYDGYDDIQVYVSPS